MKIINKYTLFFMTLTVLAGLFYNIADQKTVYNEENMVKEKKTKKNDNETQNYKSQIKIQKPLLHQQSKKYEIYNENNYCESFEDMTIEEAKELSMPRRKIEPIGAFKICGLNLKDLRNGDVITLPLINNNEYVAKVKRKTKNSNSSTTIMATLQGQDRNNYAVITEGKDSLLITLISPEGSYELEHYNNIGYIYSSKDINNSMIDYTKTDALEVYHNH